MAALAYALLLVLPGLLTGAWLCWPDPTPAQLVERVLDELDSLEAEVEYDFGLDWTGYL